MLIKFPESIKNMKDFWSLSKAFYILFWKIDDAKQTMHVQPQGTQAIFRIISMAESASR